MPDLIFAVSVVFIIVFVALNSSSQKPRVIPEELDLNSVRDALMEKQGWSLERAESARTEYIRFLTLLQRKPGFMLVPWPTPEGNDDLDQFWHQHILDTAKYAADCERLFGRIIHHNPHVVRGSDLETDSVGKTYRLYGRTFGTGPYGSTIEAAALSGCSTCATVACGSDSGHGGHDGGSHSCGGNHGCGGHGCGGHGCGSSCGGH